MMLGANSLSCQNPESKMSWTAFTIGSLGECTLHKPLSDNLDYAAQAADPASSDRRVEDVILDFIRPVMQSQYPHARIFRF